MPRKKTILAIFIFCSIWPGLSFGYLHVRFEDLDSPFAKYMIDNVPDTCFTFKVSDNTEVPKPTQFRIKPDEHIADYVNVTLVGTNLGCGHDLHVTPLSAAETGKWTGRWTTCSLRETSMYEDKELCSYDCHCPGICEEIQILKWPTTVSDGSWSVCHTCINRADALQYHNGCMFSTGYVDNDNSTSVHIARWLNAPWWYCDRHSAILTGSYQVDSDFCPEFGFHWIFEETWYGCIQYAVMMIRPN
ncbi:hypothetical protein LSH36_91g06029 [Paralvinella palmiformis]|uniref:Fibrinogen C-terminal domain-containing protein n=1 Tax=Paralvinella palmiformis TaxID=53620 RepID=A0AAD9NA82_9ANNE|nr:hypothetical protein LSH36_91g06029 [Paralvinella palmiformis]